MTQDASFQLRIDQPPATLREIVQERLREAIIEGHFAPGQRLVERPLCDQLGVSRTVIRETIRFLEAEGLVEILPNKGPIVARLDWENARQIYEIRRLLEGAAAVACAQKITVEHSKILEKALNALRIALEEKSASAIFKASTAFYRVIFTEAGHHLAWEIVQRLNGRISRLRIMTLSTTDRHQSGLAHMQAIYDAILAGDAIAARAAVESHLQDAESVARRALGEDSAST